jgi:hypothetical protein
MKQQSARGGWYLGVSDNSSLKTKEEQCSIRSGKVGKVKVDERRVNTKCLQDTVEVNISKKQPAIFSTRK